MSETLKVFLFGQFSTCSDQTSVDGLKSQKAQELFCYLLLYGTRPHHREALSAVLWGDCQNSRKYLRKALWQLKENLKPLDETTHHPILLIDEAWIQINPEANLWVDAQVFEQTYLTTKQTKGPNLNTAEFTNLKEVLKLYKGDLFERMYSDWCIFERERFREIYLSIASKLMDYCIANQKYEAGIEYGKLILSADRVHERTHRKMMRLYYLLNNRVAAIRQFNECRTALAEELSVEPSKRTQDLCQSIIKDQLPVEAPVQPTSPQISRSLKRIRQLMEMQATIDQRLPQEIKKLEKALLQKE